MTVLISESPGGACGRDVSYSFTPFDQGKLEQSATGLV